MVRNHGYLKNIGITRREWKEKGNEEYVIQMVYL